MTTGLRIVHVFTVPLSLVFLRGQVAFMRARGHELTVVSAPGPGLDTFGAREGVPVHAVPMSRRVDPREDLVSLRQLTRLLREVRPDIVHAHTPKGGLLGTIAGAVANVPTRIYHMRGLPVVTARGAQRAMLATTERTSCALSTHVLSVSASLRDEAVRLHLVRSSKIGVLASGSGNGVDSEGRFNPEHMSPEAVRAFRDKLGVGDAPLVGFVGRLVGDKGIGELAEAWGKLRDRVPTAHLVIAGTFEERDAVPVAVRERLTRDPRVHLLGFVDDTATFYAAIDVLAFPSHREGFPNVPAEAACMRVPVVAARAVGSVDAIVDGETGTLVPVGDARALAAGIEHYLVDRELAQTHGARARERMREEFRPERVWEALATFYASSAEGGRAGRRSST